MENCRTSIWFQGCASLCLCVFLFGLADVKAGGSRKSHSFGLSTPGRFTTSSTTFSSYSYGLGNVSRGGGTQSGGLLQSSMSTYKMSTGRQAVTGTSMTSRLQVTNGSPNSAMASSGYGTRNVGDLSGLTNKTVDWGAGKSRVVVPGTAAMKTMGTTWKGQPLKIGYTGDIAAPTEGALKASLEKQNVAAEIMPRLLTSGDTYATAIGGQLAQEDQNEGALKSLAPPEGAGRFREFMLEGEKAFRQGRFSEAKRNFDMARSFSEDSPESLLSLVHTYFAVPDGSYVLASLYLRRALEKFPELPLVFIDPKAFYDNNADYLRDELRLMRHVRKHPNDPEAQFLLGYIKFRNGESRAAEFAKRQNEKDDNVDETLLSQAKTDFEESRKALTMALTNTKSQALKEGIHTLWDGMVAGEFVRGKLEPIKSKQQTTTSAPTETAASKPDVNE